MFDLCKKVEIYNIQNHYYYINDNVAISQVAAKANQMHLNNQCINNDMRLTKKYDKKGIKLSRTFSQLPSHRKQEQNPQDQKLSFIRKQQRHYQYSNRESALPKIKRISMVQNLRTEQNFDLINSLYQNNQFFPSQSKIKTKSDESRIQKITTKSKPVSPLVRSIDYQSIKTPSMIKGASSQHEALKNLSETRPPISSKIQTSFSNDVYESQKLHIPYEVIKDKVDESMQYSSQKLISISKSVSSMHQHLKQSNKYRNADSLLDDRYRNSSNQISVNLSNIFSKQQNLQSDRKKSNRDSALKKLSFWQESDRHSLQSRFSRQLDITQDFEVKIEQSLIHQHDLKSNFHLLQQNKIVKKDYVMSQAIQADLNCIVSLKQFLVHDIKLIVQQLQTYELIQSQMSQKQQNHNILQLYQVQFSQNQYILIKQPYTIPMQAKLKLLGYSQQKQLREKAKKIAQAIIDTLAKFCYYPVRKLTTHQFVVCVEQLKLHDLSLFKNLKEQAFNKQVILAGLDI